MSFIVSPINVSRSLCVLSTLRNNSGVIYFLTARACLAYVCAILSGEEI